jgi:hypothetical protein
LGSLGATSAGGAYVLWGGLCADQPPLLHLLLPSVAAATEGPGGEGVSAVKPETTQRCPQRCSLARGEAQIARARGAQGHTAP